MLVISFIVLAVVSQGVFSRTVVPEVPQEIVDLMEQVNEDMLANPDRAQECFNVYSAGITAANEKYEFEFAKCADDAASSLERLEAEVASDRENVRYEGESICAAFTECAAKDSSSDFFECYLEAAGDTLTKSLDMQTLSKTKMQYVNLRYQTIEYDKKHCADESANAYVKESTTLYSQLDQCLKTGVVVTPETPNPTVGDYE
ncbi:protein TsetseEP-like [Haematobia irritans]|uniref:Putative secreted protein n=1 Tax=Haematobia irritans TaxID=7368 RepID=A0A1L8EAJ0_HAEIR